MRAPSSVSSRSGAPSLPSMRAVSISSSADRRRELLVERHEELQAQLALVEQMLQQGKPSTMMTSLSGMSAATSVRSARSGISAHGAQSVSSRRGVTTLEAVAENGEATDTRPPSALAQGSQAPQPTVPLCLDPRSADYRATSPFHSGVSNGLALPGQKLSAAGAGIA